MRVSVVIPCYNAGPYLAEAIQSALNQTRPPHEIFVVDDCSTDDSRTVAARLPVQLLTMPRNSGGPAARNVGIEASSGDVVATLDADDIWLLDHLETVVGLLEQFPEADIACSAVQMFGDREEVLHPGFRPARPARLLERLLEGCLLPHPSTLFRRGALSDVGGYADPSRAQLVRSAEDFDLLLRLSLEHRFVCTHRVTVRYRQHQDQASRQRASMVSSALYAVVHLATALRSRGDSERAALVEEAARRSWRAGVLDARRGRAPEVIQTLLSLAPDVPDLPMRSRLMAGAQLIGLPLYRVLDMVRRAR